MGITLLADLFLFRLSLCFNRSFRSLQARAFENLYFAQGSIHTERLQSGLRLAVVFINRFTNGVCSIERRHSEGKKDVNRSHERKVASIDPADRNKFTFHEEAISGMVLTHPSMYIVGIYRRNRSLSLEV